MKNKLLDFSKYENKSSKFSAELCQKGGYITFSNSGQRGSIKYFTLGLESFLNCLKDILSNLDAFKGHTPYVEKDWRDLGNTHYSDKPAKALCTVQTKPMFSTLSKIIMWANAPTLDDINPENEIKLDKECLEIAISKISDLLDLFTPAIIDLPKSETLEYSNKSIRDFALFVFKYFFENDWSSILSLTEIKHSQINDITFESHDLEIFKRVIAEFEDRQTKETLTTSNTIRYFETPLLEQNGKSYYFSTQWNGTGDYSLSFSNLKEYFEYKFTNYRLKQREGKYFLIKLDSVSAVDFRINSLIKDLNDSGLIFSQKTVCRLISSLITKPFVILTGLSGSGKTKLAQALVSWICQDDSQYCIVPVGADWTNRDSLLGYPNALKPDEYIKPDNGALDIVIQANRKPDLPHFLVLDEMNLSHVERYFADFLSVMESNEEISLFSDGEVTNGVPSKLRLPSNLFIIGTVNIDETTYMFSPKVLDRANVIEFRIKKEEMEYFLENIKEVDMSIINSKGAPMSQSFIDIARNKEFTGNDMAIMNTTLINFFEQLKKNGAEFGYRSASEICRLVKQLGIIDADMSKNEKIDIAIMQKLLPKLHGSRRKLCPVLITLGSFCVEDQIENVEKEVFNVENFNFDSHEKVRYPLSLEKIARMHKSAVDNGFSSYAEA